MTNDADTGTGLEVYLTVDVEPDCPPFMWTWRGIAEGMPRLLELFADEGVPGTFFTTGHTAETHPGTVEAIVADGHELACHGYSHNSFMEMSRDEAHDEIARTNDILRAFAPVTAFRAPYLSFPEDYVDLLPPLGIRTDASRSLYKRHGKQAAFDGAPIRLNASVTSSVLRLPEIIRNPWLGALKSPVVLFVHPWEFVDLTRENIRYDCRFRTGDVALECLRTAIGVMRKRGARFRTVEEYRPAA